ncbi:Antibiotic biosynthesis monooxygenase [Clostridium sp. DL-VIII]|uniref:putative quinol monooxygenase n=1 Tax=Clostridium sp. DL-VIII TaxID=641107 RepID=UPI00023AF193|nr:antibiotic biosynthesis monooxygenase [Clostridium sp. DL-VIII]EHI97598.1 Antibiotic biosynthesis monooxygenase [Clostridium sp. DL-VIII]
MTASTQVEEGCISFNFYEDTARPDNFVFIEKFEDENANKHHTQTAHFNTFVEGLSEFLREPLHAEAYKATKI